MWVYKKHVYGNERGKYLEIQGIKGKLIRI